MNTYSKAKQVIDRLIGEGTEDYDSQRSHNLPPEQRISKYQMTRFEPGKEAQNHIDKLRYILDKFHGMDLETSQDGEIFQAVIDNWLNKLWSILQYKIINGEDRTLLKQKIDQTREAAKSSPEPTDSIGMIWNV